MLTRILFAAALFIWADAPASAQFNGCQAGFCISKKVSSPTLVLGINFRGTSGYVTDPTGYTNWLVETYPTSKTPVGSSTAFTFGRPLGWTANNDRLNTNPPQLAGVIYSTGIASTFELDIPAGTYKVNVAIGDATVHQTGNGLTVRDNATTLITLASNDNVSANNFQDLTGAVYTAANFLANSVPQTITLTSQANGCGSGTAGYACFKIVTAGTGTVPIATVILNQ